MGLEVKLIHNQMKNIEEIEYAGMKYYKGIIDGTNIVLSTCGIGKVNAAIFTQIMIDKFKVNMIIHTGIAGSMDDNIKHGSLVIADGLTYYDVRKEQLMGAYPHQIIFPTDRKISDILLKTAGENALKGLIITGDDFISDSEKKRKLKERFPEAICVEMEGCSVANAAFVNKIPVVVIRCISDLADDASVNDYKEFEETAANRASKVVLNAIKLIKKLV